MIDAPVSGSPAPRRLHVGLLLLLPVVIQASAVAIFGSNMLLWDEFVYVDALRAIGEGRPWWPWIWRQHNEHRVVWTKLLLFAHAGLSHWDPRVEMYVSSLTIGVIAWGVWRLYRAAGGTRLTPFVPVALLLCSLAQYMNILYGFMSQHYFTVAGMVWAIVFLLRGTRRGLVAAALCAFAATISTLSGIVIWPIGLIVLVMARQSWPRRIAWVTAIAACVIAYFWRYDNPGTPSADALAPAADAVLMNLGATLAAANVFASRVLGLMTLAAIGIYGARLRDPLTRERHAGLAALCLIALASAAAVGARRSSLGATTALDSKYVTYAMFGLIGPYLGLSCLPGIGVRRIVTALTAVLSAGLVVANLHGWVAARAWQHERLHAKYLMQTFEIQTDETLASIFFPSRVRGVAAYLRATGLGPFHDRVDVLMAPRWRDGTATAAITRGTPLEAHLLCPVDTLDDLAVAVEPAAAATGGGTVYVTVVSAGAVVAQASLQSSGLTATRYIRATLAKPIHGCRGQDLTVDVTADGTNPFAAPHAWTYPMYYAGVVRQAGQLVERRSLGIAFNAFSYGLLD